MSRRAKIGIGAGLLTLATLSAVLYLRSAHFHRYVQARIVSQTERATGGRVELGSCRVNFTDLPWLPPPPENTLFRSYFPALEVKLQRLVIRGRETDPNLPLFVADSIFIRLKIASLLWRKIDWRLLRLARPRIHLETDTTGRSNIPGPERRQATAKPLADKVLDLAIKHLEVTDGELSWNDKRLPLEFAAENLLADFAYETGTDLYHGRIAFATALWRSTDARREGGPRTLAGPPLQARAELRLGRTGIQIVRMSWETPRSTLSLSGHVFASAQPKILLNYEAGLDVAEIAAVSRVSQLRSGRLQLKGRLSYDATGQGLDSSADLRLERLALESPPFRLSRIHGTGKVRITREFVEIPDLRLLLLGGELAGNFRANHLQEQPKLTLAAQARGVSVSELMRSLTTPQRPLSKLLWAGTVAGDINAQFFLGGSDATPDLEVESKFLVRPPSAAPPGVLPVSGRGELTYASSAGQLALRNISLETPGSRISAEGVWATGPNSEHDLQLNLSTTSSQEWTPLIAVRLPEEAPIALELQGRAQLQGTIRGSGPAPRLEGRLEAADFRYGKTHWTGLATNLVYSPNLLRLTEAQLRRGGSVVRLNFTAQLTQGGFTEASIFNLEAVAEDADLADLAGLTGTAYPLTGRVSTTLRAEGTKRNPQGSAWVRVTSGTLAGELNFAQGELRIADIEFSKGSAKITGEAKYRPADGSYQFQLGGAGLALNEISLFRSPRFVLGGQMGFRASGAGVPERPRLEAAVQVSDLEVNGERMGKLTASAETRDGLLEARLKSQLVRGNIAGTMSVQLTGGFPAQGRVELTGVDLDPLFEKAFGGYLTSHSTTTGWISISGPLKKPESLLVATEIRELQVALEQVELRNKGPLRASFRDGRIQIEQARLTGTQTNLSVAGWLRVTGPPATRTLELRANGEMNMALLRTLNSELIGSGKLRLECDSHRNAPAPPAEGARPNLQWRHGAQGVFHRSQQNGRLAGLRHSEGPHREAYSRGWRRQAASERFYGIRQQSAGVAPARRGRRSSRAPSRGHQLAAQCQPEPGRGQRSTALLAGEAVVTRASFNPRFDLARSLGLVRARGPTLVTTPLLDTMQLDVRVTSSPSLRLELASARDLQVQANLRLRGTVARPAIVGRVELLQGEILFAGTRYIVNPGDINFVNPFRIEPVVNLHLQTRAQQFEIFVALNGPLDRLNITYRSEPPLPSSDVQALLITGRAREGGTVTQPAQSFPTLATSAILEQALNAAVGSRIERLFGGGRVKIAPHVGGPETSPGAQLTVEQQVTPDVRLTYVTNLTSTQQQVVQLEWTINRRWSLNAVRDRNGLFGVDFKWRKQFR